MECVLVMVVALFSSFLPNSKQMQERQNLRQAPGNPAPRSSRKDSFVLANRRCSVIGIEMDKGVQNPRQDKLGFAFWLFGLSQFICATIYLTPFLMIPQIIAKEHSVSMTTASFVLTAFGAANGLGRIAAGLVADLKGVNPFIVSFVGTAINGLCCVLYALSTNLVMLALVAAMNGVCLAFYACMHTIVARMVGNMELLSRALGILFFFHGAGCLIGQPLLGHVYEALGNDHVKTLSLACAASCVGSAGTLVSFFVHKYYKN